MTDAQLTDLATARHIVEDMADLLASACERLEIAGSIRRGKPAVKDAELVAIALPGLLSYIDQLVDNGLIAKALYGDKQLTRWGNKYRGMQYGNMKIELFLADEDNWGYQYWLRTGPGDANTFVMSWLKHRKDAPIYADGGMWWWKRPDGDARLAVRDEVAMFHLLGMEYIEPQHRSEQIYKKMLYRREFAWPDFSAFLAVDPETQRLAGMGVSHYDEAGATGGETNDIWEAQVVYLRGLMERHNAIFERAARGEPLQRWEQRIVKNRREIEAEREQNKVVISTHELEPA